MVMDNVVKQIDNNVQAIKAIERTWGMPKLPDTVTLDLAMLSGLDERGIQNFVAGVGNDVRKKYSQPARTENLRFNMEGVPEPEPEPLPDTRISTGFNLENFWRTTAGLEPEGVPSSDAVSAWKQRAVDLGYLPSNTPIDNRWDPNFNRIANEIRNDDFNRMVKGGGDRPFALPIQRDEEGGNSVISLMDDWLSPTGALRAMTELGFLPNFDALSKDFEELKSQWWNPIRWVDVLDNFAMPVLNLALMTTGVGNMRLVALGALKAKKVKGALALTDDAVRTGGWFRNTKVGSSKLLGGYSDSRVALNEITARGYLAAKAAGSNKFKSFAAASDKWRNLKGVVVGKAAVGQTMRLGVAQRVEQAAGFEGTSLSTFAPGVAEDIEGASRDLRLQLVSDVFLMPRLVFGEGQIRSLAAPVRMMSNKVGTIARNSAFVEGPHRAIGDNFVARANRGEDVADEVAKFTEITKTKGKAHAVADYVGFDNLDDIESANAFGNLLSWVAMRAGVRAMAIDPSGAMKADDLLAKVINGSKLDDAEQTLLTAEGALTAQLKWIGPDDVEDAIWVKALVDNDGNLKKATDAVDALIDKGKFELDTQLLKWIDDHNTAREELITTLMNRVDHHLMTAYFGKYIDEMANGDWVSFSSLDEKLKVLKGDGLLDTAEFTKIDGVPYKPVPKGSDWLVDADTNFISLEDMWTPDMIRYNKTPGAKTFAPFNKPRKKGGDFAIARKGTVVRQEIATRLGEINALLNLQKKMKIYGAALEPLGRQAQITKKVTKDLGAALKAKGVKTITDLNYSELQRIVKNVKVRKSGLSPEEAKHWNRILRFAKEMDEDITNKNLIDVMTQNLDDRVRALNESPEWARYDIDSTLDLEGAEGKLALLTRRSRTTASAIDVDSITNPEAIKLIEELDAKGYQLVHGQQFAHTRDLKEFSVPWKEGFDDLKYQRSLGLSGHSRVPAVAADWARRRTLNTAYRFFRQDQRHVGMQYRASLDNALYRNLHEIEDGNTSVSWVNTDGTATGATNKLNDQLRKIVRSEADRIQEEMLTKRHMGKNPAELYNKAAVNVKSSFTPYQPYDLVRTKKLWNKTNEALKKLGYTDSERNAIFHSLKQSRVLDHGAEVRGSLTHWQDKFQAKQNLVGMMNLSMAPYTVREQAAYRSLRQLGNMGLRGAGGVAGGAFAAYYGAFDPVMDPDAGFAQKLFGVLATASGALGGRALTNRIMTGSKFRIPGLNKTMDDIFQSEVQTAVRRKLFDPVTPVKSGKLGITQRANERFLGGKAFQGDVANNIDPGLQIRSPLRAIARRAERLVVDPDDNWKQFSYLSDRWATGRDYMRFTLSPIFDASRYTEGMVLGQIGIDNKAVRDAGGLPFNASPTAWKNRRAKHLVGGKARGKHARKESGTFYQVDGEKRWLAAEELDARGIKTTDKNVKSQSMNVGDKVDQDWDAAVADYVNAQRSRGDFDYDALEAATARFRQVGILGFNTQEWEVAMYAQLTQVFGMDKVKAYETAKKAFAYGVDPRSAMEMNVNAVFFPFSFMKKTVGHTAEFLMDDWSRVGFLHGSLRTYEELDKKYDLEQLMADHLPILNKFTRLNVYAYGISAGEFGGANRPVIDWFNSTPMADGITNPIANLFGPIGINARNSGDWENFGLDWQRLLPALNDIRYVLDDMHAQAFEVTAGMFDGSRHAITSDAEARIGFEMQRNMRDNLIRNIAKSRGWSIEDENGAAIPSAYDDVWSYISRSMPNIKTGYDNFVTELEAEYPGYAAAKIDGIPFSIQRGKDAAALENYYWAAAGDLNAADQGDDKSKVGYLLAASSSLEATYGSYDLIPMREVDVLLEQATSWAEDSDYVRIQWRKHLMRVFGPIITEG